LTDNWRVRRLVPEKPFPAYAYVPRSGLPHPLSDPAGHSFGRRSVAGLALDRESWPLNRHYLFGFDLLNHQYYWEAHETWEPLWHASGRRGSVAVLLKGLIKLAAAGVKHREGIDAGTRTHARRASELWRAVAEAPIAAGGQVLGLRIRALIELADQIARDGWPETPVVLLPAAETAQSRP
jgi:hypothetical protein